MNPWEHQACYEHGIVQTICLNVLSECTFRGVKEQQSRVTGVCDLHLLSGFRSMLFRVWSSDQQSQPCRELARHSDSWGSLQTHCHQKLWEAQWYILRRLLEDSDICWSLGTVWRDSVLANKLTFSIQKNPSLIIYLSTNLRRRRSNHLLLLKHVLWRWRPSTPALLASVTATTILVILLGGALLSTKTSYLVPFLEILLMPFHGFTSAPNPPCVGILTLLTLCSYMWQNGNSRAIKNSPGLVVDGTVSCPSNASVCLSSLL